jgi:G3E family GTPase
MNSRTVTTATPQTVDHRPRVTVLSGFAPAATLTVARTLQLDDPTLVLLHHDISRIRSGVIRRTVRTADAILEDTVVELVHGCISCTLREDVLPSLARLSHAHPGNDLLLALPQAIEPEDVAAACSHCLVNGTALTDLIHFDSYVTVIDAAAFLDDLSSTDDLRDRDLHAADNDDRAVAQVVARQLEFADTVVAWGRQDGAYETAQLDTLVGHLAPWATYVRIDRTATVDCSDLTTRLRRTGRHDPQTPAMIGRALEGLPIGVHDPEGSCGAASVLFESRRPFHPQRLNTALPELTRETLRGRGQIWLASQPDVAIGWETAGHGINLGSLGHWLAAVDTARWPEASDMRRLAADATWDPYYGDRRNVLAFIGVGLDTDAVPAILNHCLLTDDELADGFESWAAMPDPFAGFFALDHDTDTDTDTVDNSV